MTSGHLSLQGWVPEGLPKIFLRAQPCTVNWSVSFQVAFGIDLNAIGDPDSPFPTAIRECLAAPIWCLSHPLHAIDFTSYGYQNSVVSAVHFLRDTGKKIIDERRKVIRNEEEVPSDILSYILKSVNEDTDLDYEELLDHFVTFFIAGRDFVHFY